MAKLAKLAQARPAGTIKTTGETTANYEGGIGFARTAKSELFLLAVSNFVGEDTFYEDARGRDTRYRDLIVNVAHADSEWLGQFLDWLRNTANMRSASIVGAVEAGRVIGGAWARKTLLSVLSRPDEPGEALGYWLSRFGKPLPAWFKKTLADGASALYNEFSALKYDGQGQPVRFGDVVELSQANQSNALPANFAKWLLDRRHNRDWTSSEGLPLVSARDELNAVPVERRRAAVGGRLWKAAGLTWEAASGWIQGPMDAQLWEELIPTMGYMALLRNLRNFDEAGISRASREYVAGVLSDPVKVARSKQLPIRFLSAYKAAPSDYWAPVLSDALDLSLTTTPGLEGETIILVDGSSSMNWGNGGARGTATFWEQATIFATALASGNDAKVFVYSGSAHEVELQKGASALKQATSMRFPGGGTNTGEAITHSLSKYPKAKRIIILTDEQTGGDASYALNRFKGNVYTFNIAGYGKAHMGSDDGRYAFTGMNDSGFKAIVAIEANRGDKWPWEA